MATQNKPEMATIPCALCAGDNTRPACAMLPWCPRCFRILLCLRNGIEVEVPPEVAKALAAIVV